MNTGPKHMDWAAAILSTVRHGFTTLGGAAVAYSACADSTLSSGDIIGAAAILIGAGWGVINKYVRIT